MFVVVVQLVCERYILVCWNSMSRVVFWRRVQVSFDARQVHSTRTPMWRRQTLQRWCRRVRLWYVWLLQLS